MSISTRKYHGPEVKCGGPSSCSDCRDKPSSIFSMKFTTEEINAILESASKLIKEDIIIPQEAFVGTMPMSPCICPHCTFHNGKYK